MKTQRVHQFEKSVGEKHGSFWHRSQEALPHFSQLPGNAECDVCIVGGGITGLSLASLLSDTGQKVLLLEKSKIADGTTSHTSAMLDPLTDIGLQRMIDIYGLGKSSAVIDGGVRAIDWIEKMTEMSGIDCKFKRVPAHIFSDGSSAQERAFDKEAKAAAKLGLDFKNEELSLFSSERLRSLRFDFHARFDPVLFLAGLARHLRGGGNKGGKGKKDKIEIHEHTPVKRIERKGDAEVLIDAPQGRVTARQVVLATHYPIGLRLSVQTRVFPYRSYCLTARIAGDVPDALFWDLDEPYHYFRRVEDEDGSFVLVGGADHKTGHGNPESAFENLEQYVERHFEVREMTHRWSSQFYPSDRGAPYIGSLPLQKNISIATGFDGTGLTFGVIAAHILADQINGREHLLARWADPARADLRASASEFMRENWDVAKQMLQDRLGLWLKKSGSTDDLAPGEGKVFRIQGEPCAVSRDRDGQLFMRSAVCTHAHCIVHWNNAEQTWDCPCHGGRFSAEGKVLCGPPTRGLDPIKLLVDVE